MAFKQSRIPNIRDSRNPRRFPASPPCPQGRDLQFHAFLARKRAYRFQSTCDRRGVNYLLLGEDQRIEETSYMSMQSQLADLEAQHRSLEAELSELMSHPGSDDLKIIELKRRKLHLKDEIYRLRHSESTSVH